MRTFKSMAIATVAIASLALGACSTDDNGDDAAEASSTVSSAPATSEEAAPEDDVPTAEDLQGILLRAVDPNVPTEEKVDTVVHGEEAPELFEALTRSNEESGATLNVVEPVLPGVLPDMVEATVNLEVPDRDPQTIAGVEFVDDQGTWKLDARWACTLVETVVPDQMPPMCDEF